MYKEAVILFGLLCGAKCERHDESWCRLSELSGVLWIKVFPRTLPQAKVDVEIVFILATVFLWRDKVIAAGEDSAGRRGAEKRWRDYSCVNHISMGAPVCVYMCVWGQGDYFSGTPALFLCSHAAGSRVSWSVRWEEEGGGGGGYRRRNWRRWRGWKMADALTNINRS